MIIGSDFTLKVTLDDAETAHMQSRLAEVEIMRQVLSEQASVPSASLANEEIYAAWRKASGDYRWFIQVLSGNENAISAAFDENADTGDKLMWADFDPENADHHLLLQIMWSMLRKEEAMQLLQRLEKQKKEIGSAWQSQRKQD